MRKVSFNIGGVDVEYNLSGETIFGEDRLLITEGDDLIAHMPWAEQGYTVENFLTEADSARVRAGLKAQLLKVMRQSGDVDENNFTLDQYHHFVDDEYHVRITQELRKGFELEDIPEGVALFEENVSRMLGTPVTAICPFLGKGGYFIRIVRPLVKSDNNPPHRDVWLEHLRSCVNIYFPLAGSNEKSALPIVPGSHLWKESEIERTAQGARIAAAAYQVPSVVGAKRPMTFVRPNPRNCEAMLFTPYAIHGGGINLNNDVTRMSLEMRFWRKKSQ